MKNKYIGIFDSGVGGLTVLSSLLKILPNENYLYLGDTANVPYGIKSPEQIKDLSVQSFKKMEKYGLKALVIGCNTATVYGLEAIKQITDLPVIGIIDSGLEAVKEADVERVLVVATDATINSGVIRDGIEKISPNIQIQGIGCPEMVKAVESGETKSSKGYELVKDYLDQSMTNEDSILLACTHFPAMIDNIERYYESKKRKVKIINPSIKCGDKVKEILEELELFNEGEGSVKFLTTGDPDQFKKIGNLVLDGELEIKTVEKIK